MILFSVIPSESRCPSFGVRSAKLRQLSARRANPVEFVDHCPRAELAGWQCTASPREQHLLAGRLSYPSFWPEEGVWVNEVKINGCLYRAALVGGRDADQDYWEGRCHWACCQDLTDVC